MPTSIRHTPRVLVLIAAVGCGGSGDAAPDPSHGAGSGGGGGAVAQGGSQGGTGGSRDDGAGGQGAQAGSSATGGAYAGGGEPSVADAGVAGSSQDAGSSASGAALPSLGGCGVFTSDDAWNQDISGAAVDAEWTARLHSLVGDINIHPDFGNSGDEHYGIPINIVPETQPKLDVSIDGYPEESDPGPYPFPPPSEAKVEGGMPEACDGDCHVLVVQQGECKLYEGYACSYEGGWRCGSEATWDLQKSSYGQRPEGFTSADAAGLAIAAGLARFDEVEGGEVRHALRFTVRCTSARYVPPATHYAVPGGCDENDVNAPPMGLRVRLRPDFDVSVLPAPARVIARGMQRYGMILADNGSNFYFQGEDHPGWTEDHVEPLKSIPASAFEVVSPE